MKPTYSIAQTVIRLWRHLKPRRRAQFGLLLILMLLTSFTEILTIGSVLPFLAVISNPEDVLQHPIAKPFTQALGINNAYELLMPLTIIFCMAALLAGAMRLLLLWANTRVSHAAGADLSIRLYERTLYQPYSFHLSRNSSEIIEGISSKINSVIDAIRMLLNLFSSSIFLIAVLATLLLVEPFIALVAFGGYGMIYVVIILVTRGRQIRNGKRIAQESTRRLKSLQEGLGGIRDVLIDGSQSVYCDIFRNSDLPLRKAQASSVFISGSPRFVMEAFGITLMAILAYVLASQPDGISRAIPILGALALGAQRLLPVLQHAYSSWSLLQVKHASLLDALEFLDKSLPKYAIQEETKPLTFKKHIRLRDVSFRYSEKSTWIISGVNLTIPKGSCIGIMGVTGSGKSTLLDIIMGLLRPTEGAIEVDGRPINNQMTRNWQTHIAHVPQSIFLSDTTIEKNIAFGVPESEIDRNRVYLSARQAQIADAVEGFPEKYQTVVGERGVRLSGGQRQRIGIARALYKNADVIIFDEATSALDTNTELAVMKTVQNLSSEITILIVAHRLSTLKNCSTVVELEKGGVLKTGSDGQLVRDSVDGRRI